MTRKERKKSDAWNHFFKTVVESNNSHPPVQCKYCCKSYQRAVPVRMQTHLNRCPNAPSDAKLLPKQQQLINNFNDGHMSEEQNANILSQHFIHRPQSPFELQDSEEMNMQTEYSDQSESPKAAEKGHINSKYNLGRCYQLGAGIEKNEAKAFELYKEVAQNGHITSIYELGECYQYGMGTGKNEIKAFGLYKEAAEKGHINSIHKLVECYQYGIGTEKDENKAFEYYKKAVNEYEYEAFRIFLILFNVTQRHLSWKRSAFLVRQCNLGNGVRTEKDEIKAFELYKEAVEFGDLGSLHKLGDKMLSKWNRN
ncbi:unnamed protein product [Rhizophagus irregularis]|nr:unnamed protein product [Rhizophagus irregularis]